MKTKLMLFPAMAIAIALTACGSSEKRTPAPAPAVPDTTATVAAPDTVAKDTVKSVQPVTQYALVDNGTLRSPKHIAKILRNIGFTVRTMDVPDSEDEMAEYIAMNASREGASGNRTVIKYKNGEDILITIDFADETERDAFVESMQKSGYKREGRLYKAPGQGGMGPGVYVKLKNLHAYLIAPFEMLPGDF